MNIRWWYGLDLWSLWFVKLFGDYIVISICSFIYPPAFTHCCILDHLLDDTVDIQHQFNIYWGRWVVIRYRTNYYFFTVTLSMWYGWRNPLTFQVVCEKLCVIIVQLEKLAHRNYFNIPPPTFVQTYLFNLGDVPLKCVTSPRSLNMLKRQHVIHTKP